MPPKVTPADIESSAGQLDGGSDNNDPADIESSVGQLDGEFDDNESFDQHSEDESVTSKPPPKARAKGKGTAKSVTRKSSPNARAKGKGAAKTKPKVKVPDLLPLSSSQAMVFRRTAKEGDSEGKLFPYLGSDVTFSNLQCLLETYVDTFQKGVSSKGRERVSLGPLVSLSLNDYIRSSDGAHGGSIYQTRTAHS